MEYQHIRTELADNILTVTLNRPDRMNAFTLRMKDELVHVFGEADRDNQVRAVVVTGAGRAFCAGMEMQPEDGGHVFGYDDAEGEEPPVDSIRDSGGEVSLASGVDIRYYTDVVDCEDGYASVYAEMPSAAIGGGATPHLPFRKHLLFCERDDALGLWRIDDSLMYYRPQTLQTTESSEPLSDF